MKLLILFGLPGAGKTYIGEILQDSFGYVLHDGDDDLTEEMKHQIKETLPITDDMRDKFFQKLIQEMKILHSTHEKLVVSQTFIKEKYRKQVLEAIPEANFILVTADQHIREKRLKERENYPLDINYARKMIDFFEEPSIPYFQIINNLSGKNDIVKQLKIIVN